VAFISAVPVELRVRKKVLHASEVNFLCIHKKLRAKRLTPVLIKEVTRRCYLKGVFQAVYTAGVVLPTPVSTTRYFHRSINWQKLNNIGFSPLPRGSKPAWQIAKYAVPEKTSTKGLRPMESKDIDAVTVLLKKYLDRFEMSPEFTKEEIDHWMLHKGDGEQVVWCYVVEVCTAGSFSQSSQPLLIYLGPHIQRNYRFLLLLQHRIHSSKIPTA
jgi:glycylpeptide N-tetradecanoyltransferase